MPWTDKNDALDWQSYFHHRNRLIAALLHSPYEHGGRLVQESLNHQIKHLFSLQYSTAELRHLALEDVLAGPERLHASLTQAAGAQRLPQAVTRRADLEPTPAPSRRAPREAAEARPGADAAQGGAAAHGRPRCPMRQARRPGAAVPRGGAGGDGRQVVDDPPPVRLRVVSMPDGTSAAWYQRDPDEFRDLLKRTIEIHQRLHREWPRSPRRYREALADDHLARAWSKTFAASAGASDR